jgi:hypothetical protein
MCGTGTINARTDEHDGNTDDEAGAAPYAAMMVYEDKHRVVLIEEAHLLVSLYLHVFVRVFFSQSLHHSSSDQWPGAVATTLAVAATAAGYYAKIVHA